MPRLKTVEKQIWDLEGFDVQFLHLDLRDVRGDRGGFPSYDRFERAAPGNMTVARWKQRRFQECYSGFKIRVLDAYGNAVNPRTTLRTVRTTYDE